MIEEVIMAKGKVVQVIGTVVDLEFPPDELPALYNSIEIDTGGGKIVLEVQDHMLNDLLPHLRAGVTSD